MAMYTILSSLVQLRYYHFGNSIAFSIYKHVMQKYSICYSIYIWLVS